jgi:hypothetical protein
MGVRLRRNLDVVAWADLAVMRPSLVLLGTLLLAGCSALGGGSTVGSLGTYTPDAHQCSPMRGATSLIEGSNDLQNAGTDPVVITKVELVHAEGFTLSSARLGPIGHQGKHGTLIMGVQPGGAEPAFQWMVDESVPALGAVIRPGQDVNLLLFLHAPHSNGSMMPPRVTYLENGNTRVWNGGETLTTVAGSKCRRNFTAPS